MKWEKVDSYIETRQYKDGAKPKGDKYSIRLNKSVDVWAGEAREWGEVLLQGDESPQFFYPESRVIVQMPDFRYIYENIASKVREELTKDKLIKHLLVKNPHWTKTGFDTIDWESMGLCLGKMKDTKVTNVLKMAHGWQHDGYQKGLFFGAGDHCVCPAGCGIPEDRFHYISRPAPMMDKCHKKKKKEFKAAHTKIRTSKVIYDAIMCIFSSLRYGNPPPPLR